MRLSRKEAVQEYYLNPNLCKRCNKIIKIGDKDKISNIKRKVFCSKTCLCLSLRKHKKSKVCLFCKKSLIKSSGYKYCSIHCQQEDAYKIFITKWLKGKISGSVSNGLGTSDYIYRWIKETYGLKCSICGRKTWRGNPIPLTLDHIDGNGANNKSKNLRLVCPNCDRLLPTFGNKNKGKGRKSRKQYDAWKCHHT